MPSPIERTLDKIGSVVQDIFTGSKESDTRSYSTTGQTCLEITGMRQRELHIRQNTWRRNDIEYSKPLVLAEYDIQTEFKVSTTDELVEQKKERAKEQTQTRIEKLEKKRDKILDELDKEKKKREGLN